MWPVLLEVHRALAALDGTGRDLPTPHLLLRRLQQREALKSSSLEGTIPKPDQQLLFQIEPNYPESREDPNNALREVFNHSRALRLRQETREALPPSLRLVRDLHSVLMGGVRGEESEPARFSRLQVQIGSPARYVPPLSRDLAETPVVQIPFVQRKPHVTYPTADSDTKKPASQGTLKKLKRVKQKMYYRPQIAGVIYGDSQWVAPNHRVQREWRRSSGSW